MGKADRTIRLIVGAAIVVAGFYFQSWWGLIGLVFLGTSLMRWCPAYVPFNFSTAASKDE